MRLSTRLICVCAVVLASQLGCTASRQVGTGMLAAGAVLALGGVVATTAGLSCRESADPDHPTTQSSCSDNAVTYTGLGALGAGVFVGGIGLSVREMSPPPPAKKPR